MRRPQKQRYQPTHEERLEDGCAPGESLSEHLHHQRGKKEEHENRNP